MQVVSGLREGINMVYFYSASINAFYADALKSSYGDNWPEDAQELSEIQVREFIENPRWINA